MPETTLPEGHVLNVVTGEVVSTDDIKEVARVWREMADARSSLSTCMKQAADVLMEEAARLGTREIEGVEVVTRTEYVWDLRVLRTLLDAGLPEDRWADFVETVEKVDARKLLAVGRVNTEYKSIINNAHEEKHTRYLKRKTVKLPGVES